MVGMGSGLLIVGQPLMFTKECALKTSVHMAVFLQQTHFMISRYGKEDKDGVRWLRWSHDKWHKKVFPFWAERTLRNIMYEATENGWLVVQKEPGATARYALDYESLEGKFKGSRLAENATPQGGKKCQPQGGKKCHPVPCIERDTEEREEERETTSRKLRPVIATEVRKRTSDSSVPAMAVLQAAAKNRKKISTEEAILKGREEHRLKSDKALSNRPTTDTLILTWKKLLSENKISSMSLSFTGKERGMFRNLVRQFGKDENGREIEGSGNRIKSFLEFAIVNWATLKKKIVWDNNPKRSKLHDIPNISEVYFNREDILHFMANPKGVVKEEIRKEVYTDVAQVPKDHAKYRQIVHAIQTLGQAVLS